MNDKNHICCLVLLKKIKAIYEVVYTNYIVNETNYKLVNKKLNN